MKKSLITASFLSIALLVGCNTNDMADQPGIYQQNGNTLNVSDREDLYNDRADNNIMTENRSEKFGYVRQQKSPVQGENVSYKNMHTMDREQVADSISRLAVTIPNVDDASVLVTSEEVLIAYTMDAQNKDKRERTAVADQVKKTAMSVVPRWYHVYVTDDPHLRRDIENIATMDAGSNNVKATIDQTIDRMVKESPQGSPMSQGENENGETKGEKYEEKHNKR
ncbi:hypothetical protein J2S13_001563 [Oikeobacillus pervagus]|uniref:Sporulation protein n=1 Tax=Oikeobacillus pervagus TaxID=1325931 RepID=A0AAJ1SYJ0_9BACI|nr:YhcN/YlaJ family sporulation lipoprotein [Oikeobacillus pervagus]MDQ0215164.1 hypothetical protein [Oikeobacillus pervagus]